MGRALIIGCGGVAGVAIHKCCQNSAVFEEIMIASRTKAKCDALKEKLDGKTDTKITTAQVNADNKDEVVALIKSYQPDLVMNIALPYQDLTIMEACLACKVNYMDTANLKILTILRGARFTKNAVRRKDFRHILTIHGSGHIGRSLRRPASRRCLALVLIRV